MTTSRSTSLAVFAAAATVSALALTGCGGKADVTATPATSAAKKEPREILRKAVPDEKAPPYAFKIKGNVTPPAGIVDGPNNAAEITVAQEIKEAGTTLKLDTRLVAEKGWVKIAF